MIEAIRASQPQFAATPPLSGPPIPANDVAGWWNATPATPGAVVQTAAANDATLADRAQANALLADDVYRAQPTPPVGYRVASNDDLDRLGITPSMLEQPGSSFRARVYVSGSGDSAAYTVAFRGSSAGEDWANNAQQALGLNSESYAKALQIGRQVARSDEAVTFTGHSLGGGLASAAAVASGREADTFNTAGLHDDTIGAARAIATANDRGVGGVQAYYVPGEVLHMIQHGGDRALGGVLGGIPGAWLADAPEAYGTQHALPDIRPEGKSFFDGLNPVDRHGMNWVIGGVNALN